MFLIDILRGGVFMKYRFFKIIMAIVIFMTSVSMSFNFYFAEEYKDIDVSQTEYEDNMTDDLVTTEMSFTEIRDYVRELLNRMNIELVDVKFDCCGMPFLTTGNFKRFEEQTRENLKKLEGLKYDYIVTDCASCEYVIREKWKVESGKFDAPYPDPLSTGEGKRVYACHCEERILRRVSDSETRSSTEHSEQGVCEANKVSDCVVWSNNSRQSDRRGNP